MGTVIVDPTLQLLAWSGAFAVITGCCVAFWVKRHRFFAWYWRLPSAVRCLFAGCLVWLFCVGWFYGIQSGLVRFPNLVQHSMPFGLTHSLCGLIAWPIALGGRLFVWGDNGPPAPIFHGVILNMICGLAITTSLSAAMLFIVDHAKAHSTEARL